jgi:hypothetical protein
MSKKNKKVYTIDIPNSNDPDGPWINVKTLNDKAVAVVYVKSHFGGDSRGRIDLISEVEVEET